MHSKSCLAYKLCINLKLNIKLYLNSVNLANTDNTR